MGRLLRSSGSNKSEVGPKTKAVLKKNLKEKSLPKAVKKKREQENSESNVDMKNEVGASPSDQSKKSKQDTVSDQPSTSNKDAQRGPALPKPTIKSKQSSKPSESPEQMKEKSEPHDDLKVQKQEKGDSLSKPVKKNKKEQETLTTQPSSSSETPVVYLLPAKKSQQEQGIVPNEPSSSSKKPADTLKKNKQEHGIVSNELSSSSKKPDDSLKKSKEGKTKVSNEPSSTSEKLDGDLKKSKQGKVIASNEPSSSSEKPDGAIKKSKQEKAILSNEASSSSKKPDDALKESKQRKGIALNEPSSSSEKLDGAVKKSKQDQEKDSNQPSISNEKPQNAVKKSKQEKKLVSNPSSSFSKKPQNAVMKSKLEKEAVYNKNSSEKPISSSEIPHNAVKKSKEDQKTIPNQPSSSTEKPPIADKKSKLEKEPVSNQNSSEKPHKEVKKNEQDQDTVSNKPGRKPRKLPLKLKTILKSKIDSKSSDSQKGNPESCDPNDQEKITDTNSKPSKKRKAEQENTDSNIDIKKDKEKNEEQSHEVKKLKKELDTVFISNEEPFKEPIMPKSTAKSKRGRKSSDTQVPIKKVRGPYKKRAKKTDSLETLITKSKPALKTTRLRICKDSALNKPCPKKNEVHPQIISWDQDLRKCSVSLSTVFDNDVKKKKRKNFKIPKSGKILASTEDPCLSSNDTLTKNKFNKSLKNIIKEFKNNVQSSNRVMNDDNESLNNVSIHNTTSDSEPKAYKASEKKQQIVPYDVSLKSTESDIVNDWTEDEEDYNKMFSAKPSTNVDKDKAKETFDAYGLDLSSDESITGGEQVDCKNPHKSGEADSLVTGLSMPDLSFEEGEADRLVTGLSMPNISSEQPVSVPEVSKKVDGSSKNSHENQGEISCDQNQISNGCSSIVDTSSSVCEDPLRNERSNDTRNSIEPDSNAGESSSIVPDLSSINDVSGTENNNASIQNVTDQSDIGIADESNKTGLESSSTSGENNETLAESDNNSQMEVSQIENSSNKEKTDILESSHNEKESNCSQKLVDKPEVGNRASEPANNLSTCTTDSAMYESMDCSSDDEWENFNRRSNAKKTSGSVELSDHDLTAHDNNENRSKNTLPDTNSVKGVNSLKMDFAKFMVETKREETQKKEEMKLVNVLSQFSIFPKNQLKRPNTINFNVFSDPSEHSWTVPKTSDPQNPKISTNSIICASRINNTQSKPALEKTCAPLTKHTSSDNMNQDSNKVSKTIVNNKSASSSATFDKHLSGKTSGIKSNNSTFISSDKTVPKTLTNHSTSSSTDPIKKNNEIKVLNKNKIGSSILSDPTSADTVSKTSSSKSDDVVSDKNKFSNDKPSGSKTNTAPSVRKYLDNPLIKRRKLSKTEQKDGDEKEKPSTSKICKINKSVAVETERKDVVPSNEMPKDLNQSSHNTSEIKKSQNSNPNESCAKNKNGLTQGLCSYLDEYNKILKSPLPDHDESYFSSDEIVNSSQFSNDYEASGCSSVSNNNRILESNRNSKISFTIKKRTDPMISSAWSPKDTHTEPETPVPVFGERTNTSEKCISTQNNQPENTNEVVNPLNSNFSSITFDGADEVLYSDEEMSEFHPFEESRIAGRSDSDDSMSESETAMDTPAQNIERTPAPSTSWQENKSNSGSTANTGEYISTPTKSSYSPAGTNRDNSLQSTNLPADSDEHQRTIVTRSHHGYDSASDTVPPEDPGNFFLNGSLNPEIVCYSMLMNNVCTDNDCSLVHDITPEMFSEERSIGKLCLMLRDYFNRAQRLSCSFMKAIITYFVVIQKEDLVLALFKKFLTLELPGLPTESCYRYFTEVVGRFIAAMIEFGYARPDLAVVQLFAYCIDIFKKVSLECVVCAVENIDREFNPTPLWPILGVLKDVEGFLISDYVTMMNFDEMIQITDVELMKFYVEKLLELPGEKLFLLNKKMIFIQKLHSMGLTPESKELGRRIINYAKLTARRKIICENEHNSPPKDNIPQLDQIQTCEPPFSEIEVLRAAEKEISQLVKLGNTRKLVSCVIKYSENNNVQKSILNFLFENISSIDPLKFTEALLYEFRNEADETGQLWIRQFCGSLILSFTLHYYGERKWKTAKHFTELFHKFNIDKYNLKTIYCTLSPAQLVMVYSEIYVHNKMFQEALSEIIDQDVYWLLKEQSSVSNAETLSSIAFFLESLLCECLINHRHSSAADLFDYILNTEVGIEYMDGELPVYFEALLNQFIENSSPIDDRPVKLYLKLYKDYDINLHALPTRVLLCSAFKNKMWAVVDDLFRKGYSSGAYPYVEEHPYTMVFSKYFVLDELFVYFIEWSLNFMKRRHQGSRFLHGKWNSQQLPRSILITFKEDNAFDELRAVRPNIPPAVREDFLKITDYQNKVAHVLKSLRVQVTSLVDRSAIISVKSLVAFLQKH